MIKVINSTWIVHKYININYSSPTHVEINFLLKLLFRNTYYLISHFNHAWLSLFVSISGCHVGPCPTRQAERKTTAVNSTCRTQETSTLCHPTVNPFVFSIYGDYITIISTYWLLFEKIRSLGTCYPSIKPFVMSSSYWRPFTYGVNVAITFHWFFPIWRVLLTCLTGAALQRGSNYSRPRCHRSLDSIMDFKRIRRTYMHRLLSSCCTLRTTGD